jgi:NADPH-dependent 2,4-dienoyl-CoA reductase/sulfur reductase-like enzyme
MENYDYLILGGGMTAHAAIKGIREMDASGSIGLVTEEPVPPYKRPPLSKGLWKEESIDDIWYETKTSRVQMHLSRQAVDLCPLKHQITDSEGVIYQYGKLLMATGGTPRQLPFDIAPVIYFRTLADYQRLKEVSGQGKRIGVIGGGFIGSEIAAALAFEQNEVVLIFPESGINGRILPEELSIFLNRYYEKHKVEVIPRHLLTRLETLGESYVLGLKEIATGVESLIEVDVIVAGLGITPNDALAKKAGLNVSDGVEVDGCLRTSSPDIYAAGDVANFYSPALEKRIRIEHEDNALHMGLCAGRNMAGDHKSYQHLSYFYSDFFDIGYEAVGDIDPRLEIIEDWIVPHCKGVIYYCKGQRVRGVLLWNVWNQVPMARSLIQSEKLITLSGLQGRIG